MPWPTGYRVGTACLPTVPAVPSQPRLGMRPTTGWTWCLAPGPAPTLQSIAVTPANPTILTGGTQQFTATGTYSDNSTQNLTSQVTWASSSTAVATIGTGGLATGVGAGTTTISATLNGVSGNTGLTVQAAPPAPTLSSIAVTPANPTILTGATQQFTATGTYSDSSTQNLTSQVTWASSSTAVATIGTGGLATGVSAGTTTISATLSGVSGSTGLTVQAAPLSITTASLPNGTVGAAYSATLAATGGTGPYSWSMVSGSLPSGLTLNLATGVISGTPTAAATSNFTVQVTDSASPAATSSKALSITVAATPTTVTIWPSTAVPGLVDGGADSSVELGVKFRSDVAGTITGIRFYKASANTGTHVGNLWSSTGTKLATVTFTNETASGWQQMIFSTPVAITANTVYVASYHANAGHYSADVNYFATAGVDNPPLHALANGVSGGNGVYAYGASSAFPTQTWNAANYWVDVVFSSGSAPTLQSIAVTPANPTIPTGGTQQFTATGTYSDDSTQNLTSQVTWTSSSTAVATINAAGLVTGLGAGQTVISATFGGVTGKTGYVQVPPPAPAPAPVSDFAASVRFGLAPVATTFSCKSLGEVTARRWDFGDGGSSTAETAVHTYTVPGTYAVSLWASGPGGEDAEVKSAFIAVMRPRATTSRSTRRKFPWKLESSRSTTSGSGLTPRRHSQTRSWLQIHSATTMRTRPWCEYTASIQRASRFGCRNGITWTEYTPTRRSHTWSWSAGAICSPTAHG